MDYNKLIRILNKSKIGEYTGKGLDLKYIEDKLATLNFEGTIPQSYIEVQKNFGYYFNDNFEIVGLHTEGLSGDCIENILPGERNETSYFLTNNVLTFYPTGSGDYFAFNLLDVDNENGYEPIYFLSHEDLDEVPEGEKPNYKLNPKEYEENKIPYFKKTKYKNLLEWVEDGLKGDWDYGGR